MKNDSISTAIATNAMVGQKTKIKRNRLGDREPTSMFLDPHLWREAKKTAIDLKITVTEFVEKALKNEIARGVQK
jgi:hypothetical protein